MDNSKDLKNSKQGLSKPNKDRLGDKFNENLDDELSEFEETRAIKTIMKHEEILEAERIKELEEERKVNKLCLI